MEKNIKGKIYCIRNTINDKIYVGSTIQELSSRMREHIRVSKINRALNELGIDNFYIELIENYDCKTKDELRSREQYYIRSYDSLKNGYNGYCAKRDEIKNQEMLEYFKKYCKKNKEKVSEYQKKWRENNKDKLSDYFKKKCKEIVECEICKCKYTGWNKSKHEKTIKHKDNLNKQISPDSN